MSALLLSLISGTVVAATPVTPQPWFEFHDYPMKAFERNSEGITGFELLISPDGAVASCSVTSSSGDADLDKTSCFLATKRAKFRPARNSDGQAVWGTYRTEALWAIPEHRLVASAAPDVEVSVNALPAGTMQPPAVKLAYAVDTQGNPDLASCTVLPSSLNQPEVLAEIGCKELLKQTPHAPVIAPSGQPVPAIKTGAVLFKTGG
jgi:TonB family protein